MILGIQCTIGFAFCQPLRGKDQVYFRLFPLKKGKNCVMMQIKQSTSHTHIVIKGEERHVCIYPPLCIFQFFR